MKICIIIEFNSIKLINIIINKGVFLGIKFIKKIFKLNFKLKIKNIKFNFNEKNIDIIILLDKEKLKNKIFIKFENKNKITK